MEIAVNRTIRNLKQVSIDGILAGVALFVLLLMLGYWGFMRLQLSRVTTMIAEKQDELLAQKQVLKDFEKNPGYLKFLTAKYLESETKTVNREQSLTYLTNLLEELKAYNRQQKSVNLANFQIDAKKITLQGSVSALKNIYAEGGIIDKFSNYPFIKSFTIPYYRQNTVEGGYDFLLDADIYHYDGSEPTS